MALIKCPECTKDVSDKAATCPFCGHPIGGSTVTIQKTNKRWKVVAIISFFLFAWGLAQLGNNSGLGGLLIFLALFILIISRVGAWWTNG